MHFQGRQWEQDLEKNKLFFLSLRAGGILQILMQSDWFQERAGFHFFFKILLSKPGGIVVASSFKSLFVVCE